MDSSEVFGPHGLGLALRDIQTGICDAALVVAAGLVAYPKVAEMLRDMSMLSPDDLCHSFEEGGKRRQVARSEWVG